MLIHLLWSGSHRGGAQNVAFALARQNRKLITTSVRKGTLSDHFSKNHLIFINTWARCLLSAKFVIASDYRAICIVLLFRLLALRSYTVIGVIHSNRKKSGDRLLKVVFRLFNTSDTLIVTTNSQLNNFRLLRLSCSLQLCRLVDINQKPDEPARRGTNVMFFGRVTSAKRVADYFNAVAQDEDSDREYFIFGPLDTDHNKLKNSENIQVHEGWFDLKIIISKYKIGFVVVPNPDEGISLVTIECIKEGVIPLTRAVSAIDTLGLPDTVMWSEKETLQKRVRQLEFERVGVIAECQDALRKYQARYDHINSKIENVIDETNPNKRTA